MEQMTKEEALGIIRDACRTNRQLAALHTLGLHKPWSGDWHEAVLSDELTYEELHPWEVDWKIAEDGTLLDQDGHDYDIEGERLTEDDWILHLSGKGWIDLNTFIPAYFEALAKRGIKELTIKTSR